MSPDLDTRIRNYGNQVDRHATSLETLTQKAVSTARPASAPRSRWALATGAAAVLVVAIGSVAALTGLFSGGGGAPVATAPEVATLTFVDGTWQRTVLPAGLHVGDVATTSFGLVAAAGPEGIWISADGVEWEQVFVGPHEPFSGTTSTLAPPSTAPPPLGNVETFIRHVAEYEGALYAVGTNLTGSNGPDMTGRMIVYGSEDGQNWEETVIKETGDTLAGIHPIDLVATDSGLVVYAEGISSAVSLFRSEDGRTWTELNPDETGLASVGIHHGVTPYSAGFIAVVEDTSLSEEEPTQVVYRSADGIRWEPIPEAVFAWDDYSVALPGRFAEYGDVLFMGGIDMVWETDVESALWRSTDGFTFDRLKLGSEFEPMKYLSDLVSTPNGLLVVGWSWPTETDPARMVLLTTTDGVTFIPVEDEAGLFDNVQDQEGGIVFGDSVLLFATDYQSGDNTVQSYQWTWTPDD